MPIRLEDGQDLIESGLETAGEISEHAQKGVKRFWNGFSEFALSENVLQVAIGLMYVLIRICSLCLHVTKPKFHN